MYQEEDREKKEAEMKIINDYKKTKKKTKKKQPNIQRRNGHKIVNYQAKKEQIMPKTTCLTTITLRRTISRTKKTLTKRQQNDSAHRARTKR